MKRKHVEMLNALITAKGYKSYLEIGTDIPGYCYYWIDCETKESCDPYFDYDKLSEEEKIDVDYFIANELTYHCTSDEMFANMPSDKKYDLIFVDGLHTEEQSGRDIINALKHLNQGGMILVHDCIPVDELASRDTQCAGMWMGGVWKSVSELKKQGIKFYTVPEDTGCCFIPYVENAEYLSYLHPSDLTWEDFQERKEELLNIQEDYFIRQVLPQDNIDTGIMKKRLVYHYYYSKDASQMMYNVHYECLKYFKDRFDEVLFVISVDDINDKQTILSIEHKLLDIGYSVPITFKVISNDSTNESRTFITEVADKLGGFDGWTFFAHTKGVTNIGKCDDESILKWVISAYYLGLGESSNFNYQLHHCSLSAYGFPLYDYEGLDIDTDAYRYVKNRWMYAGTIFWLNEPGIKKFLYNNHMELPQYTTRWHTEEFLGNIFPHHDRKDFHINAGTYGDVRCVGNWHHYYDAKNMLPVLYGENDPMVSRFNLFYNYIMDRVK